MSKNIKHYATKYLFVMVSLLPVSKGFSAGNKNNTNQLESFGEYTFYVGTGFEHLLPSKIINSQIRGTDLEGFNPGFFVEVGAMNWSGQHGRSNYEHHIGFSGRFDYHNFNSRAFNVRDYQNAHTLAGEPNVVVDPTEHGCANVNDLIWTFNVNSGIGWYGATVDANCGLGWHFDNHGNFGPVIALGTGLGYRINKNFKLNAKWRLNIFPCENLNSKTFLPTSSALRNTIEIGAIYKLNEYRKGMQQQKTRKKHR